MATTDKEVELEDGSKLPAEMVLLATGVIPNTVNFFTLIKI